MLLQAAGDSGHGLPTTSILHRRERGFTAARTKTMGKKLHAVIKSVKANYYCLWLGKVALPVTWYLIGIKLRETFFDGAPYPIQLMGMGFYCEIPSFKENKNYASCLLY